MVDCAGKPSKGGLTISDRDGNEKCMRTSGAENPDDVGEYYLVILIQKLYFMIDYRQFQMYVI